MSTDRKALRSHREHIFSATAADAADAAGEQDENQLVKASQGGDQNAFAMLVQRHQRYIFNLSLRLVHDYDAASEITQEAFVAAWQALPTYRGKARFATWLSSITYYCGLRQFERQKQAEALLQVEQSLIESPGQETSVEDIGEQRE